jgi:RimJ/RimL family protein N-acetyltransferase
MDGPLLTTERLLVRRLAAADREAFRSWRCSAAVMAFIGDGRPLSVAAADAELDGMLADFAAGATLPGRLAVVRREGGDAIGWGLLYRWDDTAEVELGYGLAPAHWGRGYATELAAALVAHARDVLRLPSLVATVQADNAASVAVLRRAGFVRAGVARKAGREKELYRWTHPATPEPSSAGALERRSGRAG